MPQACFKNLAATIAALIGNDGADWIQNYNAADGDAQAEINISIGGVVYDLL